METSIIYGMQTWHPHAHTTRKMKRSLPLFHESEAIGSCKGGGISNTLNCIQRYSLLSGLISNKWKQLWTKAHKCSHLAAKTMNTVREPKVVSKEVLMDAFNFRETFFFLKRFDILKQSFRPAVYCFVLKLRSIIPHKQVMQWAFAAVCHICTTKMKNCGAFKWSLFQSALTKGTLQRNALLCTLYHRNVK